MSNHHSSEVAKARRKEARRARTKTKARAKIRIKAKKRKAREANGKIDTTGGSIARHGGRCSERAIPQRIGSEKQTAAKEAGEEGIPQTDGEQSPQL